MPELLEDVNVTRMDLLELDERLELTRKGHKLLKEKRDTLINEFFEVMDEAKGVRKELAGKLESGRKKVIKSKALMGSSEVETLAECTPVLEGLEFDFRRIMGVKVPKVESSGCTDEFSNIFAPPVFHETLKDFREALQLLVDLIEKEETIRKLGEEIKKVKRRTNALEHILIPNLEYTQKYIETRLEEIERENFFKLKIIKRKKSD